MNELNNLANEKLEEEIKLVRIQQMDMKNRFWLDTLKIV
ncbi:Uncharacterized protein dnl_16330 [Desulfonema limicola]|uniref:Uncharacterized protein n=1 Tax=Desulfonema limicola TaxID=45656 RepID=A0A975B5V0_9BACT|nr:Uncharacterized protein dnl_16330 [Desulfonema limicola]